MTPYIEVQVGSTDGRRLYAEFVAIAAAHELDPTVTSAWARRDPCQSRPSRR